MARRRGIVYAFSAFPEMGTAVGYVDPDFVRDALKENIDVELDFEALEKRAGQDLTAEWKADILREVNVTAYHIAKAHIEKIGGTLDQQYGRIPSQIAPESEFIKLVAQLEKKAQELTRLVDRLVDINPALACRPKDGGIDHINESSVRGNIDLAVGSHFRVDKTTEVDLMDYYSFRKGLDYLAHFESCNALFNNQYSQRYRAEHDYTDIEMLVRRVIVDLRRTGFPVGVAIPTDANPDYESPLIAVLLDVIRQLKEFFDYQIREAQMPWQDFSYRQMSYLASKILDDLLKWDEVFGNIRHRL